VKISDNLLKINNLGEEKIKETANELIAEHFINPSVLGNMEPRDCINMAIQIKGDKFSIMDSIETFISADHLFSWNSDEYKDVINKAKAFSECLLTNPINSDKIEKATAELRKSIKDYEKHCELKPRKGNPTREKRLSAINNLKDGLDHLEASAKSLTEIEKKGPNIDAREDVAEDISLYKTQKIKEQQEHFKELRKDAPQEKAEKQVQKQQEPQKQQAKKQEPQAKALV